MRTAAANAVAESESRRRAARLEKVETLQNYLVGVATGGGDPDLDYAELRRELLADPLIKDRLPRFVRTCRDTGQFWQFIKYKFGTYAERREYLWGEFRPLLEMLEGRGTTPADAQVGEVLASFDTESVHQVWQRALDRRKDDPEGAITLARTLLEAVCTHILDDAGIAYGASDDLPKLYHQVSLLLQLAPSQHTEADFKRILGGCTSVVEGLGGLRNRLGDAHGKGKKQVKPSSRHAELAVNLAGAMAVFLVETWNARKTA